MSLESGKIPQNSTAPKSKECDVNPFIGTSKNTSIKREVVNNTPFQQARTSDSSQFSFMKDLEDMNRIDDGY